MKRKNGFTLIELLAVIIILALLMTIAIPSVTRYINQSRKKTYVKILNTYVDGLTKMISNGEVPSMTSESILYYIPFSCIELEKSGKSPNGDWDFAYVILSNSGTKRKYFVYAKDIKNQGVLGIELDKIEPTDIKVIEQSKDDRIYIDGKIKSLIVSDTCDYSDMELTYSAEPFQPADSCFEINGSGVITKWNLLGTNSGSNVYNNKYTPATDDPCYSENLLIPSMIKGITVSGFAGSYTNVNLFAAKKLKSVVIPAGITRTATHTFRFNHLTDVKLPEGLTNIEAAAFSNNRLENINIPTTVTTIGDNAFASNSLTTVLIPDKVTSLGSSAFAGNKLSSLIIPNSVTTIGNSAFSLNQLITVTIPNTVSSIGSSAFLNNSTLDQIILQGRTSTDGMTLGANWNGVGKIVFNN